MLHNIGVTTPTRKAKMKKSGAAIALTDSENVKGYKCFGQ